MAKQIAKPKIKHLTASIADPGKVRVGDAMINAKAPPIQHVPQNVADPGKVRVGDAMIYAPAPRSR